MKFGELYNQRSKFLHDGNGRGTLNAAGDAALEIGLELLLADIAQSARNYGGGVEANCRYRERMALGKIRAAETEPVDGDVAGMCHRAMGQV